MHNLYFWNLSKFKAQQRTNKEGKDGQPVFQRSSSLESVQLQKYERFAEFIEKYAVVIFSVVFIIFNVIYWSWLLTVSDYYNWSVNETLNADVD